MSLNGKPWKKHNNRSLLGIQAYGTSKADVREGFPWIPKVFKLLVWILGC